MSGLGYSCDILYGVSNKVIQFFTGSNVTTGILKQLYIEYTKTTDTEANN